MLAALVMQKQIADAFEALEAQIRRTLRERDVLRLDLVEPPPMDTATIPPLAAPKTLDLAAAVLERANAEFHRDVRDPRDHEVIDGYIRRTGLGWAGAVIGANGEVVLTGRAYTLNGDFQWCGAFGAHCWGFPGGLKATIRHKSLAGASRLYRWGQAVPERIVPRSQIRPGCLLAMGYAPGKRRGPLQGSHIGIAATAPEGGMIWTREGNAHGTGPTGERIEGVITQHRSIDPGPDEYGVLWAYWPLPGDMEG